MEHVGVFRPLLLSHLTGPIPCLRAAESKSLIAQLDAEVRLSTAEIWDDIYKDSYSLQGFIQFTSVSSQAVIKYRLHHVEAQASSICQAKQLSTLNSVGWGLLFPLGGPFCDTGPSAR